MLDGKTQLCLVPGEINTPWPAGTRADGTEFRGVDEVLVADRTGRGSAAAS